MRFTMAFADSSTYFVTGDSSILGSFEECDCGNYFEFSENRDDMRYALPCVSQDDIRED